MKTQLIPLESHDDLISVRDRMSWAKTPRILLVWPKSERIPLRALDLKVLQRHAAALGAQLGLVTRHRDIWREAQALDIPVFGSTGEAQRSPWPERDLRGKREWRRPRRDLRRLRRQVRVGEEAWRSHPATRILSFTLGVLAVLLLASLFIPKAEIVLASEKQLQVVTLPVRADPSVDTVFITGNLPARELRVIVEGTREALATGEIPVPKAKAEGAVTFRNLTEGEVTVPAGTVLTSTGLPGVRFVTLETSELAPGLKASMDVPVQAEQPGAAGNVEAGTILAVEGNLGLQVAVSNAEPTVGGSDLVSPAATEEDRGRLRQALVDELRAKAQEQMRLQLAAGDVFFPDTVSLAQALEETYDPPTGQSGRKVALAMQVEFAASYASGADLAELAGAVLNASLPAGFVSSDASLALEALSSPVTGADGVTRWDMQAKRTLARSLGLARVIPLAQGRSPQVAEARLAEALSLAEQPRIVVRPSWWPWLPLIPFNITVETQ
ncbi:MAG: baseplate J/gp47 family protein [Chloroflexota bacterium]